MNLANIQFYLARISHWLDKTLVLVCGFLLCFLGAIVFFEVMIRYVIHAPTSWTEELARFLLVWYGLLAAAVGAHKGTHFALRFGVMYFDARTRWAIRQAVNVGIILFLAVILKEGIAYLDIVGNQTSMGTEINMSIPFAGIPVGIGTILIIYILEVADAVLSIWTGRQFSVKEVIEEEINRNLRPGSIPMAPAEKR